MAKKDKKISIKDVDKDFLINTFDFNEALDTNIWLTAEIDTEKAQVTFSMAHHPDAEEEVLNIEELTATITFPEMAEVIVAYESLEFPETDEYNYPKLFFKDAGLAFIRLELSFLGTRFNIEFGPRSEWSQLMSWDDFQVFIDYYQEAIR